MNLEKHDPTTPASAESSGTAFGCPRDFLGNHFVYAGVSSRTRGLCIGINMNPDRRCNFHCLYCETPHNHSGSRDIPLNVDVMAAELEKTLIGFFEGDLRNRPLFRGLPDQMIESVAVMLSGDGEPTMAPDFLRSIEAVVHLRALGRFPFFKIILLTNGKEIDSPDVKRGFKALTKSDEIWVKFDAGTQSHLNRITRTETPLETILRNILTLGRERPITIQSLFPAVEDREPSVEEIEEYAQRLLELKAAGAQIELVQICSATRMSRSSKCSHLSLRQLSDIARTVTKRSGLKSEVF